MAYAGKTIPSALASRIRSGASGAGLAVALFGATVLVAGWLLGIGELRSVAGHTSMKANTAACFVLCGASLWLLVSRASPSSRRVARACAGLAVLTGVLTLLEYLVGRGFGIDQLLATDPAPTGSAPGRMPPQTAIALVQVGVALLAFDYVTPRGRWPSGVLAVNVGVMAILIATGYIYEVPMLYRAGPFTSMAPQAPLGFMLLAAGIACARPDRGLVSLMLSDTTGGVIARSLMPPAVLVPPFVGAVVLSSRNSGLFGDAEAIWMFAASVTVVCIAFAAAAGYTLQAADIRRRTAERRLGEAERWYRALVEQLPVTVYVDELDESSTSIYMSPKAEEMLGYPPQQWLDDPELFAKVLHPEDRARVRSAVAECIRTGEPLSHEYRMHARDGRVVWVHDEAVVAPPSDRRPNGYLQGYFVDITERKRAEEERAALEGALNQRRKLESLGELAGGIAHDFNNLLGVITSYADLVDARVSHDPQAVEDVGRIRQAAEHGAQMTRRLLVFGQRGTNRPEPLELNECVRHALPLIEPLLGDHVELRTELAAGLKKVRADRSQIEQVLFNLVLNAHAAIPSQGSIVIRTRNVDEGEGIPLMFRGEGSLVCLSVGDTGAGMSSEVRERAFEPFFTTNGKAGGTGLGLATVYGIVSKAGGEVVLRSEPGRGTEIDVYLPAQPIQESREPAAAAHSAHGETVLVVDDNEDVRSATARILRGAGYATLEASGGTEAQEVIAKKGEDIDLLLTDVVMPDLSGPELGSYAADHSPRTAVLYMSGYVEGQAALGDEAVLEKPFDAERLLTAVVNSLGVKSPA